MKKFLFILCLYPSWLFAQPQNQVLHIGEYVTPWIDSAGNARSLTSNVSLMGTNNVGTPGLPGLINTGGVKFWFCDNILHGMLFIDKTDSSVWTSGGCDQGQCGLGSITAVVAQLTKITQDSLGNPFKGISMVQGFYINNADEGAYGVKRGATTDTVFGWGHLYGGMAMTSGVTAYQALKPYAIYWRTGHHIVKMAAEKSYAITFDDGVVQTGGGNGTYLYLGYAGTGTQYQVPHTLSFPASMTIQTLVGGDESGFLCLGTDNHLYGYARHNGYMGVNPDGSYSTPQDLNTNITSYILNGTTRTSFLSIGGNSNVFYVIPNDSTLWVWGDAGMSGIGNGLQPNLVSPPGPSTAYNIDPAQILVLQQQHPVQVTNKHNFIKVFSGCLFGFTVFALDANGQIWGWGRNKGGVLGDGVVECVGAFGDISANYANSWDRPYATPITPYSVASNIPASCPGCKSGVVTTFCSECTIPTTTPTAAIVGGNTINTTSSSITASGLASTCTGGKLTYYKWTGADGLIEANGDPVMHVSGLSIGAHTFTLQVTDNGFNTSSVTLTVNVLPVSVLSWPRGAKPLFH